MLLYLQKLSACLKNTLPSYDNVLTLFLLDSTSLLTPV